MQAAQAFGEIWRGRSARLLMGIVVLAVAVIAMAWRVNASSDSSGGVVPAAPSVARHLPVVCFIHLGCGGQG